MKPSHLGCCAGVEKVACLVQTASSKQFTFSAPRVVRHHPIDEQTSLRRHLAGFPRGHLRPAEAQSLQVTLQLPPKPEDQAARVLEASDADGGGGRHASYCRQRGWQQRQSRKTRVDRPPGTIANAIN